MTASTLTELVAARARASGPVAEVVETIASTLRQGLGPRAASAVLYFASSHYDPSGLAGPLAARFPDRRRLVGQSLQPA